MTAGLVGSFPGGLVLEGHKSLSNQTPIRPAGLPARLIFPLRQRNGEDAPLRVSVGDHVLRGSLIAGGTHLMDPPIYASSSGQVMAFEDHDLPHPSGGSSRCVVIETDGQDESLPPLPLMDAETCSPESLLQRIHEAGIVGLGGAAFPTAAKWLKGESSIDTLIVNGAECEPYITCDDRLLRERADDVIRGTMLLSRCLDCNTTLIAVETDMPEAHEALLNAKSALGPQAAAIGISQVPARYPAGGERQLIPVLTGREVPSGTVPAAIGILCQNVATVAAIYRSVTLGERLDSRIVTVTGGGVKTPQNLEVRLGTPVSFLIEQCGGYVIPDRQIKLGGPMMGHPVTSDAMPVTRSVNAILVTPTARPAPTPQPCIRCGACAEVCPARLLPQQLYWHAQARQLQATLDQHLFDCIECGCCDAVCPSHIPLAQEFRQAKQTALARQQANERAAHAHQRFEARQARKLREQQDRETAAQQRKASLSQGASPKIQEALERARQKRASRNPPPVSEDAS